MVKALSPNGEVVIGDAFKVPTPSRGLLPDKGMPKGLGVELLLLLLSVVVLVVVLLLLLVVEEDEDPVDGVRGGLMEALPTGDNPREEELGGD